MVLSDGAPNSQIDAHTGAEAQRSPGEARSRKRRASLARFLDYTVVHIHNVARKPTNVSTTRSRKGVGDLCFSYDD